MTDRRLKDVHPALPDLTAQMKEGRLDRREFLRMSTLLGLSATAAYGLTGLTPMPARADTPKQGGTVKISMRIPKLSDPATFQWVYDSNVTRQVNEYLTRTGVDNVTRPHLLEKWEASEDLKTWTLTLRSGITWSNGDPLTSDDIIWNLKRLVDPEVGSSFLGLVKGYLLEEVGEGDDAKTMLWADNAIEKVDDLTLRLNCKAPQLAVPEHMFHYPAAMLHPSSNGVWGVGAIGTGPFNIDEIEIGKRAVLSARRDYWGEGPYIDRLEFIDHGDEAAAALAAIAARQVDGMYEASTTQYAALQQMEHLELFQVSTSQTAVARMQPLEPPFDDARVRKAMRLALDTRKILQVAHLDLGDPGEGHHVAPVHPEYASQPFPEQDIEGAKALLAEAGYPEGFETSLAVKKDPVWELVSAEAMKEMWAEIGVTVNIDVMPSAAYWEVWTDVPFGLTAWTHRPLAIMLLPLAYRSGVPWNESKWSNEEMDALLLEAEGTLDVEKRQEIMARIQTLMMEEGPAIIPLWRGVFTPMAKRVKGFNIHPTYYFFAEEWWVEEA